MDSRDDKTWVILELTKFGEKCIEDQTLKKKIRKILDVEKSWPIFIPTRIFEKEEKKITIHLMEGYVFIQSGLDEVRYFKLENTKIGHRIMTQKGPRKMRVLHTLSNEKIEELKKKLFEEVSSDITVGMIVTPTEGPFSGVEGEVISDYGDTVHVFFDFESRKIMKRLAKVFLTTS